MPTRWNVFTDRIPSAVKRAGARYGARTAIVLAGTAAAIGTVTHPRHADRTPLVQRVVASSAVPTADTARADSAPAGPRLDNGHSDGRIDSWIRRFTSGTGFELSLERMSEYADMITAKLDAKRMPRDLIYLAMIESNFDPSARSQVHAVGLWQFMTATAKRFGLAVHGKVDERRNPERSTDAALAYLEKLHDRFGSWYLAAAAYNSGEGTVSRALRRVTGRSKGTDDDFFRISHALPRETRDYVPKLIAATRVGNDPARYGLSVKEAAD